MKIVNRIITLLVVVGLMTGCTQRRYSHVTGFQLNNKSKTEKTVHSGHYVNRQNTKPAAPEFSEAAPSVATTEVAELSPRMKKRVVYKNVVKSLDVKKAQENEEVELAVLPDIANFQQSIAPKNIFNKVKSKVGKKTKDGGLIYWILVLLLLILIITLLNKVLGPTLTGILILIVLIAFVGHLIGIW